MTKFAIDEESQMIRILSARGKLRDDVAVSELREILPLSLNF